MPERFDLEYTGSDGQKHRPVIIHRAPFGSLERFIGVLIEHYAGNFPLWLAPVQAVVLPITDEQLDYAKKVHEDLKPAGIRAELDDRNEKIGYKIREWETQEGPVHARGRGKGTAGRTPLPSGSTRKGTSARCRGRSSSRQLRQEIADKALTYVGGTSISKEKRARINEEIRVPEVRVIDQHGGQLGVMTPAAAIALARERDADLVEIVPNAVPAGLQDHQLRQVQVRACEEGQDPEEAPARLAAEGAPVPSEHRHA